MQVQAQIEPNVYRELEYLVALHQQHGAANPMESVEQLVGFVLAAIADGSRRPGSWERQLLDRLGLVADCDAHRQYRGSYGAPSA